MVDRLHLQEGKVFLPIFWLSDLSADDISCSHAEATDLGGGDVDVIGAGKEVVLWGSQEPKAFWEDFQDTLSEEQSILLRFFMDDLIDQILFL